MLNDATYFKYYLGNRGVTLILDYSAKLPRKVDIYHYHYQIQRLKPTAVVLPSVDYSALRTIDLVREFLGLGSYPMTIGTLQGNDLESLDECYSFLKEHCDIIGLPSPLEIIARRDEIIRDIGITGKVLYIEVYANPFEEVPPKDSLGVCTSYPLRLASEWRKLSDYKPTPKPLDFHANGLPEGLVVQNVREYKEVLSYVK